MSSHVIGQYSTSIYISAVSLGHLQHFVIGHDGKGGGGGGGVRACTLNR